MQQVITLEGALKLIMWLPGNMAKGLLRSRASCILTCYLVGYTSMHEELEARSP